MYCVQEARVPSALDDVTQVEGAAKRRGVRLDWGADMDGQHLLAFAHRSSGVYLRTAPVEGLSVEQAARMQYAVAHMGRSRALHVVQLYGYADGATKNEDNEHLVLLALAWLRSLGDVPALIVGDLNLVLRGSGVEPLLSMAGWHDILAQAGPTCLPSSGAPSRIDYVLANRSALVYVRAAGLRWDLGLATHAALEVELEVEAQEPARMRRPVPRLDGSAHDGWPHARAGVTEQVDRQHGPAFRSAVRAGRMDAAWQELAAAMTSWLGRRLGQLATPARRYASAKLQTPCPRSTGREGDAAEKSSDAALLRLRRLRNLLHAAARVGIASQPARSVLAALRRDEEDPWWVVALRDVERRPGEVAACVERAEAEHEAAQRASRERRREAWHKWVTEALANGGGRLYRWIKADSALSAPMVPDPGCSPDGSSPKSGSRRWLSALRGGAAAQLRFFERHWRQLWQRPVREADDIEEWLAELDGLPAFPERVPWTIPLVRAVLKKMAKRKAPGLDGWTVSELRLLPDELLAWIVDLFEEVERQGVWPSELCQPEGLLLPKPGDGGPMDRRPIWLLPMLYRVWAAGRAQLFARWRSSWQGADGGIGAEELAWDLALDLEAAEANSEDIVGAALDWRKAFDHVSLRLLRIVLQRAGVPPWLLEPLMATYSAPRRLRVDGALGEKWTPTSGILPGCALAVFALSVLIRPWYQRTGRIHDSLRRRVYVDDLTVWARGDANEIAEVVADALAVTRAYEQDLDWRLHEVKSKQFANRERVRAWLREQTPAIAVTTEVKDLGVLASAGKRRRAPVSAARLQLACGRFARIRRIPATFRWRCLLGAAAGTAAGTYGAMCGQPPARELEQLRRAAKTAVSKGGLRVAAEMVFGVLSPTWRLDPKAVAVLAPLLQAVRGLRSGTLCLNLWRTTAAAVSAGVGRATGPVAAALASMRALSLGDDVESWVGVPAAPQGWRPATQPFRASLDVLLAAWLRAECRRVAARRRDYAHLAGGIDRWATRRLFAAGTLGPQASGALRAVICGNVVTESLAAKWTGRSACCPHCQLADEDQEHRFWQCPAWDVGRGMALAAMPPEALGSVSPVELRRLLPDGVARTGTLPLPARLAGMADAASCEDPSLPPQAPPQSDAPRSTVWTDGACLHPTDPLLARAAWGLRCEALALCNWGGPVDGAQTAQRAEVMAVLAASRAVGGPIDLASDSEFVVKSCAKLAAGANPCDWAHSDLWAQIEPHVRSGRIRARWVPAHKTQSQARQLGLSERDRLGNSAADSNAGAAARQRLPHASVIAERKRALGALEAAQRVLAATHHSAIAANAQRSGERRQPRDWRRVRRGTRPRAQSAPAAAGAAAGGRAAPQRGAGALESARAPPRGEVLRQFFAGQSWHPHAAAQGPGRVTCIRCGACARNWRVLSAVPCGEPAKTLPVHAQGLLLLGELHRAGGSAVDFNRLVQERLAQLPQAPD